MAVFAHPGALEDRALRAFLAALGLLDEATRLAVEVDRREGVDIRPRIGLNSGQAIAGEIGSGALGDTASRFRRQSTWLTTCLSNAT